MNNTGKKGNTLISNFCGHLELKPFAGNAAINFMITLILAALLVIPMKVYAQGNPAAGVSLHSAALQGNIDAVERLIKAGRDLNEKDTWGSTPLIVAITFNRTEVAKALINAGADLKVGNNEGSTPLHLAAFFCRPEIIKALLDKGADRYIRNNNSSTAYDIVAAPFEDDKYIYDKLSAALKPLGLKLDYQYIKKTRPQIAKMLRPGPDNLESVNYSPLDRDDWKISIPEEHGLDPESVAELYLDADHLETLYGLLVIKDGSLIAEKYFNEGSVDQVSRRASVTKSYVSAMTGIALEQGCLSSLDQKMIDFFPEIAGQIKDPRKKQITIRQMLQMQAGYPWEETDSVYWNEIWSGDYIHCIADFPLTYDPGTQFQYSNLTSHWLGIILARSCNTDLKSFGQKNLFAPLKVEVKGWNRDVEGYYIGGGDIQFTARDMAKFGQLYLNKGEYGGQQLVRADWVKESLKSYSNDIKTMGIVSGKLGRYFRDVGYGYHWWSAKAGSHRFNFAWGHGGQLIILLDDMNMVIVTTADPFYGKDKHMKSWKYEKSIINLVGKFIDSLPEKG